MPSTVLDLLGIGVPDEVDGNSLVALMRGGGGDAETILSTWPRDGMCAWRRDNWKLIWKPAEPGRPESWELYDLNADPGETHNVAAIQVEITEKLSAEMFESNRASRRKLERFAQGMSVEIDAELRANLRALGYLGDEN